MAPREVPQRIRALRTLVAYHQQRYHEEDAPEITDEAYDALVRELRELEAGLSEKEQAASPASAVGGSPKRGFKKVHHSVRQWSYDNVFSFEELEAWEARLIRMLEKEGVRERPTYCLEQKIDGLKVVLTYEKGRLVRGATRGDGTVGEDITENLKTIRDIPQTLPQPLSLVVGGEAWLARAELARINAERAKVEELLFANTRNAAAGALRQLDPAITASRNLSTFMYSVESLSGAEAPQTQTEALALLDTLGFHVNRIHTSVAKLGEARKTYETWIQTRNELPYDTDGMVVKVESLREQHVLGFTSHAPRFAVAFKFPAKQVTTRVEDIVLQVGRTGVLTPVAVLTPVRVAGSVVSRATLHNEDQIQRLDVRVGDTVILQKAGDVIPEVVAVLAELRSGHEKPYRFPKRAPECGGDGSIERVPGTAAWRCVTRESAALSLRRLQHFVSKKALDVDGLGPRTLKLLMERGLISTYPTLFTLRREDLEGLPGFQDKAIENLLASLERARTPTLARFIFSLSIDQVGEETARLLAAAFPSVEALAAASIEELERLPGVGPVVATSIREWFSKDTNRELLSELLRFVTPHHEAAPTGGVLNGVRVVVTGTLPSLSRTEAVALIRDHGGTVSESVSKETTFVLAGDKPGSKAAKAQALGVPIIDEAAFLARIGRTAA